MQSGRLARQGADDKPVDALAPPDFPARAREASEFFPFSVVVSGPKIEQGNYKNLIIANRPYYWNHSNFMRLAGAI
jgi:hypothetical protein